MSRVAALLVSLLMLLSAGAESPPIYMMRHALAPGGGDPPGFTLDDCRTQRNLCEAGREQARRAGEWLRGQGVVNAEVRTSEWCRCRDTARLLNVGEPVDLPLLNSYFTERSRGPGQMTLLREWLQERDSDRILVLVTHQVVITDLTGIFPASGEILKLDVEEGGSLRVLHREQIPLK